VDVEVLVLVEVVVMVVGMMVVVAVFSIVVSSTVVSGTVRATVVSGGSCEVVSSAGPVVCASRVVISSFSSAMVVVFTVFFSIVLNFTKVLCTTFSVVWVVEVFMRGLVRFTCKQLLLPQHLTILCLFDFTKT